MREICEQTEICAALTSVKYRIAESLWEYASHAVKLGLISRSIELCV